MSERMEEMLTQAEKVLSKNVADINQIKVAIKSIKK